MSKIYVLSRSIEGAKRRNVADVMIGAGWKPEEDLVSFGRHRPCAIVLIKDLGSLPAAEMVQRAAIFRMKDQPFSRAKLEEGGWTAPTGKIVDLVAETIEDFENGVPIISDTGAVWRQLRTDIFKTTQVVMSQIGGVSESQISRYEGGRQNPDWIVIARWRGFAIRAGLPWNDKALFSLKE